MNRFISLIILVFVIVAGWTGAWFYAAKRIKEEAQATFTQTLQSQTQIDCETLNIAGYPFRFDVTCTNLVLTNFDLSITLPSFQATVLVYRPTHILLFANGPASFVDSFSGSRRELRWQNFRASLRTNGWELARLSLEADQMELVDLLIGETQIAKVEHIESHLLKDEGNISHLPDLINLLALAKIKQADAPEFQIANAQIQLEANLSAMPDDLRFWSPSIIAASWHQNETGVDVTKLEGRDDISSFSIIGTLTTTAQAMTSGNFDFFSTELAQRFAQFMDPTSLQVVFGHQSEDGSHYQSYSLVHGVMLAGNFPILTFGPMR